MNDILPNEACIISYLMKKELVNNIYAHTLDFISNTARQIEIEHAQHLVGA